MRRRAERERREDERTRRLQERDRADREEERLERGLSRRLQDRARDRARHEPALARSRVVPEIEGPEPSEREPGPPPVERRPPPARRPRGSETGARVWVAIPAIAYAIAIVALGGPWFAAGVFLVGVIALHELYGLMRAARPIDIAGFIGLAGILAAALYAGRAGILVAFVASLPLVFVVALMRPGRENVSWGIAATLFGLSWIGLALAHAVLLREIDHGGALVVDVLIGTFVGDTCAYFGGRAWGRRLLAPGISPKKTVAGLVSGVVGGTLAFWGFAVAYQDFFASRDALLIGFCVAVAAPIGDLFESLVKRDLEAKDTGSFFGPHGGALDRVDAVLFSAVVGYYASIAVL
jgi:phosphatidate cytidylyltransferase